MRRGDFPPRGPERSVSDSGAAREIRRWKSDRFALVVEDNARAAEVKGMMLPGHGCRIDTARDRFEAIVCFRAGAYGVLTPYHWLSGMNGGDASTGFAALSRTGRKFLLFQANAGISCKAGFGAWASAPSCRKR